MMEKKSDIIKMVCFKEKSIQLMDQVLSIFLLLRGARKTWNATFTEYIEGGFGIENPTQRTFDLGRGTISNDAYEMPMELSLFRVYNRALTQEEININFEEVRSRFNL